MFPECLAIVSEAGLTIGNATNMCSGRVVFITARTHAFVKFFGLLVFPGVVDDIQKLHIRKIALNESPRRLAYASSHRDFAVCLTHVAMFEDGIESIDRYMNNIHYSKHLLLLPTLS